MVNDDNCTGHCVCPWCGGPAYWSFMARQHSCADRECEGAKEGFPDHTQDDAPCGGCGSVACICD